MDSIKTLARRAGLLYFLLGITAPIGLEFVPAKLFVAGDPAATVAHLRASETLIRLSIASELVHQVISIFVALALYRLFKAVNEGQATLLVVMSLLGVPIMFLNVLNEIATLMVVGGGDLLSAFGKPQLDALAFMFYRLHSRGIVVASVFWGLWLFPFGYLVIRSGFIPKLLGYLLYVAGAAYLAAAFTTLIMPSLSPRIGPIAGILEIAEVPIIFWLLIWGTREKPPSAA